MQFTADNPGGAFVAAFAAHESAIAQAATDALRDVTQQAVAAGRRSIAAGGFGQKWQNALRGRVFPDRGSSLRAAGVISHKIPYASIFEDGGVINGQPLLWIAITQNVPASGRKWTPRLYIQKFGPLVVVAHSGRKPLLFDPRRRKFVFFGVPAVTLQKHFDIAGSTRAAVSAFDAAYNAHFKVE